MRKKKEEQITPSIEEEIVPASQTEKSEPAEQEEEEENVISVWYGSGNTSRIRRRHFDGYTQYETLEKDGKTKLHNVYTGYYFEPDCEKKDRNRRRLYYTVSLVVSVALMLFCSTRIIQANRQYAGVTAFVALCGMGWFGYGVFNEFTVPWKRTIGDYRASSQALIRGALMAAIASGATALVTVVFLFIDRSNYGRQLLALGGELVTGGLMYLMHRMESKVTYIKTRSKLAGKYTM